MSNVINWVSRKIKDFQLIDKIYSLEEIQCDFITEPPPPLPAKPPPEESTTQDEDDEVYIPRETRSGRGSTKRSSRGGGNKRRHKRQKVNHHQPPEPPMEESTPEPSEPEVPEPAPDANMHLKFTYGVNAWKHWVIQKNAQLEKVSKQGSGKLKMFKTDMMGCTADELNYSLCLFVKEVRKPNGEEYAPDSIFYLCLGKFYLKIKNLH